MAYNHTFSFLYSTQSLDDVGTPNVYSQWSPRVPAHDDDDDDDDDDHEAQSTTKDYIRAEGDFHKDIYLKGPVRQG